MIVFCFSSNVLVLSLEFNVITGISLQLLRAAEVPV